MANVMETQMYKTSDMALVVLLKQEGNSVQTCLWDQETETVYWTFYVTPSLMELCDDFSSGNALVEPREYNRLFQLTKKEMYAQADPHRQH